MAAAVRHRNNPGRGVWLGHLLGSIRSQKWMSVFTRDDYLLTSSRMLHSQLRLNMKCPIEARTWQAGLTFAWQHMGGGGVQQICSFSANACSPAHESQCFSL